jgi:hypothetical protein
MSWSWSSYEFGSRSAFGSRIALEANEEDGSKMLPVLRRFCRQGGHRCTVWSVEINCYNIQTVRANDSTKVPRLLLRPRFQTRPSSAVSHGHCCGSMPRVIFSFSTDKVRQISVRMSYQGVVGYQQANCLNLTLGQRFFHCMSHPVERADKYLPFPLRPSSLSLSTNSFHHVVAQSYIVTGCKQRMMMTSRESKCCIWLTLSSKACTLRREKISDFDVGSDRVSLFRD